MHIISPLFHHQDASLLNLPISLQSTPTSHHHQKHPKTQSSKKHLPITSFASIVLIDPLFKISIICCINKLGSLSAKGKTSLLIKSTTWQSTYSCRLRSSAFNGVGDLCVVKRKLSMQEASSGHNCSKCWPKVWDVSLFCGVFTNVIILCVKVCSTWFLL